VREVGHGSACCRRGQGGAAALRAFFGAGRHLDCSHSRQIRFLIDDAHDDAVEEKEEEEVGVGVDAFY
jgi:hypothetical protein